MVRCAISHHMAEARLPITKRRGNCVSARGGVATSEGRRQRNTAQSKAQQRKETLFMLQLGASPREASKLRVRGELLPARSEGARTFRALISLVCTGRPSPLLTIVQASQPQLAACALLPHINPARASET
jgi:hypothetical protein